MKNNKEDNTSNITKKLKYVKPLIESFFPRSAYADGKGGRKKGCPPQCNPCNPQCTPCGPPSGCPPNRGCQPKCTPNKKDDGKDEDKGNEEENT